MRHFVVLVVAALLSACGPDPARQCRAIFNAQRMYDLEVQGEALFEGLLTSIPGYDTLSDSAQQFERRSRRAQSAAGSFRFRDSLWHSDSAAGHNYLPKPQRGTPQEDSAEPTPKPPPRPSEIAWYAENCFEGKPR